TVECNVTGGTGEGSDWDPIDDLANFGDNDSTGTCQFQILADADSDVGETLIVTLQNPFNGTIGSPSQHTVTIGSGQTFSFQSATYTVQESAGSVTVTVVRSSSAGTGSVQWDIVGGTATAGVDYIDASGTVNFSAGETTETFNITILSTAAVEANETILVSLFNPVNGDLGTPDDTVITITEIGVPTVTDVTPGNIPVTGGTVVVTGTNFTGTTVVTFGSVNAVSFVINNSTQITAVAPARPAGTYDIRVTNPAGTSANTVNDNITYGAAESITYQLSSRWSLIAWLGKDNANIASALQGTVSLTDSQAQTAPNNIFNLVTAVASWDNPNQRYLFWFPAGGSVPGANDITQFNYGTPYWIAVNSNVNWTVVEGP
ncbi:MAG: Calx-beta domain-containing protein, partial [Dehalococcoidia bacterium]